METRTPQDQLKTRAQIVYILYGVGLLFWIPLIAGIILAYLSKGKAEELGDKVLIDNFTWQINSFWGYLAFIALPVFLGLVSLLSLNFGFLAFIAFVGAILGLIGLIWFIYRIIKGWLALSERMALYTQEEAKFREG